MLTSHTGYTATAMLSPVCWEWTTNIYLAKYFLDWWQQGLILATDEQRRSSADFVCLSVNVHPLTGEEQWAIQVNVLCSNRPHILNGHNMFCGLFSLTGLHRRSQRKTFEMLRDSYWVRTVTQFHCHHLGNTHSEASSDILQSRYLPLPHTSVNI